MGRSNPRAEVFPAVVESGDFGFGGVGLGDEGGDPGELFGLEFGVDVWVGVAPGEWSYP
jgi:hypothetical protein